VLAGGTLAGAGIGGKPPGTGGLVGVGVLVGASNLVMALLSSTISSNYSNLSLEACLIASAPIVSN
jgi:hypothetical protein